MKNVFCSKEMTYPKLCDFFPADYSSLGCHVSKAGIHRDATRNPFAEVPGSFSAPDSPGVEFSVPRYPRSPKSTFLTVFFFLAEIEKKN